MDTGSGGTLTVQEPGNPALDAARAALNDIATNPNNPRHAGYQRGDAQVSAYLDQLYKNAVPADAPVGGAESASAGGPDEVPTVSPEDAQMDAELRDELGDGYAQHMDAARGGVYRLTQRLGGEVDDLMAAALDAGVPMKQIVKLLGHYEQRMRG